MRGRGTRRRSSVVPALTIAYLWALRRFPAPRWRVACFAGAMVLLLSRLDHADRDDRVALPALGAPDPERRPRGVGAAARRARDPAALAAARAAGAAAASRWRSGSSTTASGTCRGSTTPRSAIRIRCSTSSTPLLRHRRPALVADRARRRWPPARRRPTSSPRSCSRARSGCDGARARADLRLLRRGAAAVGARRRSSTSRSPASRWRLSEAVVFFAAFAFFFARFFAEQDAVA